MASRFSETVDKSSWCHNCYTGKHMRCTGVKGRTNKVPCGC